MQPSVMFVCVKNGGKSQMAAAIMRQLAGDEVRVVSAGTHPGTSLNEASRASVEEVGATFDGEYPKPVDPSQLREMDRVVLVGSEAELAPVAGMRGRIVRWDTDEPSLRGIEGDERMRLIRDDITARVRALLEELRAESPGS